MISAFMLDALLTATALGLAAWVAEHSVRSFGIPGRWVWVVAVIGAVALPAIFMVAPQVAADPATLLGPRTVVYALSRVNSGCYGPNEILKNKPLEKGVIERSELIGDSF